MDNKKLVRNTRDKVFGGVCSGFADYFGWDSTWVRVIAALSLVFMGTPILVYLILWLVIPADVSVYGPNAWQGYQQQQPYYAPEGQQWQGTYEQGYTGYAQGYPQASAEQPGQPGEAGQTGQPSQQ